MISKHPETSAVMEGNVWEETSSVLSNIVLILVVAPQCIMGERWSWAPLSPLCVGQQKTWTEFGVKAVLPSKDNHCQAP